MRIIKNQLFQAHYSIKKAAHWLGIGLDNVIIVESDNQGRMLLADLENKIQKTLSENKKPFFVNATSGTTVLGAFDDLNGIADVCEKYNLWMHVDVTNFVIIENPFKFFH